MVAQQKKLLYLVHRIPYPPNKGDKIRSFNILKFLSRHYQVYLGTFVDDSHDWRYLKDLETYCEDMYAAPLKSLQSKLRSLPALWSETPLSLPYYRDAVLQAWVDRLLAERPVRQAIVFSGAMAQYLEKPAYGHLRRIVDFVDVDSDKWRQYAGNNP